MLFGGTQTVCAVQFLRMMRRRRETPLDIRLYWKKIKTFWKVSFDLDCIILYLRGDKVI